MSATHSCATGHPLRLQEAFQCILLKQEPQHIYKYLHNFAFSDNNKNTVALFKSKINLSVILYAPVSFQ